MKIALAQLNYHIGDFKNNVTAIREAILKAIRADVDLVVFSELSICGYPPLDLLEQKVFINQCKKSLDELAGVCNGIAAIVGSPTINPNPSGKNLYNSAYFLSNGKVLDVIHKTLLPTYDIFDEYRYFESNTEFRIIHYKGKKIALTICEDLWDEQPFDNEFEKTRLYTISPMEMLKPHQPDLIINIAASPFSYTREWAKKEIIVSKARKYAVPVFYVNQVGAQTELIFEGGSMVVNQKGEIHDLLHHFKEDFRIYDFGDVMEEISSNHSASADIYKRINDALVMGLRDYFLKMKFQTAILGLSGGIDSAVSLVLAVHALGNKNVYALLLPSKFSTEHSVTDAKTLADNLNVQYEIISIQSIVENFNDSLRVYFRDYPPDITEENIQARIRAIFLMAFSNKFGHILLNTSNKSEAAVGYGTLYGDMCGGLSLLGDVYKTDVYKLAEYINRDKEIIPRNTIKKPPSAELRPNQKDTDSLPDYEILDKILYYFIELQLSSEEIIAKGFDGNTVERVIFMVNTNEYKRYQAPPILRISSKAFGAGRRIPLVAKY
ncbi:NAD+ synthase [Candidatus Heimdallarchaeota archaeon B3_Heim]|nr:MAG: NAD+ synthase [Candidatus Heimdallarchaeota archaeon B3_Heim]